jgi:hypothetical protein
MYHPNSIMSILKTEEDEQPRTDPLICSEPRLELYLDRNLFLKQLGINVEKYPNIEVQKIETDRDSRNHIKLTLGIDLPEDFYLKQ